MGEFQLGMSWNVECWGGGRGCDKCCSKSTKMENGHEGVIKIILHWNLDEQYFWKQKTWIFDFEIFPKNFLDFFRFLDF